MKLTETKLGSASRLIDLGDGLHIKRLTMSEMLDHFKGLEGSDDLTIINKTFDKLVVDENGDKFEDLIKKKATNVLPIETITTIMDLIVKSFQPDPKV